MIWEFSLATEGTILMKRWKRTCWELESLSKVAGDGGATPGNYSVATHVASIATAASGLPPSWDLPSCCRLSQCGRYVLPLAHRSCLIERRHTRGEKERGRGLEREREGRGKGGQGGFIGARLGLRHDLQWEIKGELRLKGKTGGGGEEREREELSRCHMVSCHWAI